MAKLSPIRHKVLDVERGIVYDTFFKIRNWNKLLKMLLKTVNEVILGKRR